VIFVVALTGCSSTPRAPSVAILISVPGGSAPSPADVASVYKALQPEIEKYGYVIAKNTSSADFVVYVTDPADPLGSTGGRIRFERFDAHRRLDDLAAASRDFKQSSDRANGDMVTEPKE
jgi:hypothetical protein